VPHTWETEVSAFCGDAVVQKKMTAINADLDAITAEGYDAVTRHGRIVALRRLRYVLLQSIAHLHAFDILQANLPL
jgi:hypothetical protein